MKPVIHLKSLILSSLGDYTKKKLKKMTFGTLKLLFVKNMNQSEETDLRNMNCRVNKTETSAYC